MKFLSISLILLDFLFQTRIIFQSLRDAPTNHRKYWELYSMEDDGSDVQRITHNLYWESQPDVSPDGKRIVFAIHYNPDSLALETDPGFEIAVMDIDGKNLKRLTSNDYLDCCPHWNPDGTRIVYVSGKHKGDGTLASLDIYTMSPDGDSVRKLTDARPGEFYADPSFSNKRDRILYVYCRQGITGWDIWMMNEDGSDKHLILSTNETYLAYHDPMFSPDDNMMVFEAMLKREGNHGIPVYKIFTAGVDGSNIKQITDRDDETDVYPQYSPDGERLLYFTWRWEGVFERRIRTIDTVGIDERILSTFSPEIYPSWYPEVSGIESAHLQKSCYLWSYPNPFTKTVKIKFQVPEVKNPKLEVGLKIYDVTGRLIRTLAIAKLFNDSITTVLWDGTDNSGEKVSSGIYFCILRAGDSLRTQKLLLLR